MKMPRANGAALGGAGNSVAQTLGGYINLGYAILPCSANKLPVRELVPHGLTDATTDAATLPRWLATHRGDCWGLLPPAGVLVLDADTAAAAEQLERDYPEATGAPCCRTPRGGAHFYLCWPDHTPPPPTRTGALADVDIRGLGRAYLIVPPSRTERGTYRWERPLVPPAALPLAGAALVAALTPTRAAPTTAPRQPVTPGTTSGTPYARAALQREHDAVAAAPEGTRNDTLNRAAYALGQLVAGGALERAEVGDALLAAAATCGLPPREAQRTIESGLTAGALEPRTPPAPRPVQTANCAANPFARFFIDGDGHKRRLMQNANHIWRGRT